MSNQAHRQGCKHTGELNQLIRALRAARLQRRYWGFPLIAATKLKIDFKYINLQVRTWLLKSDRCLTGKTSRIWFSSFFFIYIYLYTESPH